MITLITPTGGRPGAFALCERYMARQTLKWDQWIVVDDYEIPTKCTMGQDIIRPEPFWKQGDMTLPRNLLAGLKQAKGDKIIIIEDDDWYHPEYIEKMSGYLDTYALAGEGGAQYYNVNNHRYIIHENYEHASLCQTGFTRAIVPQIMTLCQMQSKQKFLDIHIWKLKCFKTTMPRIPICVGIKGMPGRGGIGYGHRDTMGEADTEPYLQLKKWIGLPDADIYVNMLKR